ncbi:rhodanese-like domain-containing protein [Chryseobacterium polytrichastri]|uniref:Rhodanese-like domain-containing protein n=1 Tax=Chryseobacterium polytrichastri TaxID=1302687 RepID=A0A1M7GCB4_9FLAO|nr:rhodanese-like domain-containing protein [Chryseobacterium polytrichastri]SHM13567.1 Rhodanese-like domain-containing protein [Chryseobacterium polytrichastri]
MKNKIFGLILVSALALSACKTATASEVSNASIRKMINNPDVTLVDVRTPEQFAGGSADNAINVPLAEIINNPTALKGKKVVVFCNKGIQADEAVTILKKNGVEVYDGTSWRNVKGIQDSSL